MYIIETQTEDGVNFILQLETWEEVLEFIEDLKNLYKEKNMGAGGDASFSTEKTWKEDITLRFTRKNSWPAPVLNNTPENEIESVYIEDADVYLKDGIKVHDFLVGYGCVIPLPVSDKLDRTCKKIEARPTAGYCRKC